MNVNYSNKRFKLALLLYFSIFAFLFTAPSLKANDEKYNPEAFEILPWEVGQYAIYQIVSIENDSLYNRYKFFVKEEEIINGSKYFWLEITVTECSLNKCTERVILNSLVAPITTEDFIKNPGEILKKGLFPYDAIKSYIRFESKGEYAFNPSLIDQYQSVIKKSDYILSPEAKGRIDFSKMKVDSVKENIFTARGKFECFHFYVDTNKSEEYYEEGFDLWRSLDVPFLGIVRMDFSKTQYWEKFYNKNNFKNNFQYMFSKVVPGRERLDTYSVNLISYGKKEKK